MEELFELSLMLVSNLDDNLDEVKVADKFVTTGGREIQIVWLKVAVDWVAH
jgi:hypothetical protein